MVNDGADGCPGMRFKTRLDVMGFGAGPNDAKTDGFVVLQLQFNDGFDDSLSHGQTVLRFAFLDDAKAHRSVVRWKQAGQGQRHLHGSWHPHHLAQREPEVARFLGHISEHPFNFSSVEGAADNGYVSGHGFTSLLSMRSTVLTMVWVMVSISMLTRSPSLRSPKLVNARVSGMRCTSNPAP